MTNQQTIKPTIFDTGILVASSSEVSTENDTIQGVTVQGPSDPTRKQWMRLAERSSIFQMWAHESEDGYTLEDGEPV